MRGSWPVTACWSLNRPTRVTAAFFSSSTRKSSGWPPANGERLAGCDSIKKPRCKVNFCRNEVGVLNELEIQNTGMATAVDDRPMDVRNSSLAVKSRNFHTARQGPGWETDERELPWPVAQVSNLLYRRLPVGRLSKKSDHAAGWKPATQQVENLRYTFAPMWAGGLGGAVRPFKRTSFP